MDTSWDFKPGDEVVYPKDPLQFGRMLVVEVEKNVKVTSKAGQRQHKVYTNSGIKRIACLVCPDAYHRRTEWFYPGIDELALADSFDFFEEKAA